MAHDEFAFIRQWTSRSAGQEGNGLSVGIGDDAAVFAVSAGMEVVACCDAMIETVHFLRQTMTPEDIGYKGMISNISDIAAMGGLPRYALVTIGLSPAWTPEEAMRLYTGIYQAAEEHQVRVIGGDTVSTPDALHVTITLLGEVERGKALRRSFAKPGDLIFVTGPLGASAAGLHLLLADDAAAVETRWQPLLAAHRRPRARVEAGRLLLHGCTRAGALNDISDGLASELWEIAEASGVSLRIEAAQIPVAAEAAAYALEAGKEPLDWALYGGEDYELVGTVGAADAERITRLFRKQGLTVIWIGQAVAGEPGVWLQQEDQSIVPLPKAGYNHFRQEP